MAGQAGAGIASRSRLAVASIAWLCVAAGPWPAAGQSSRPPHWALARAEAWLAVLEGHVPGTVDSALLAAATWSLDDLRATWLAVNVAVEAAASSKRSGFDAIPLDQSARPRPEGQFRIRFNRAQRQDLDRIVTRLKALGIAPALRRAVIVHTDLVTLTPQLAAASFEPAARGSAVRMNVGDGSSLGFEGMSVHWEIARLLLTLLPPSAAAGGFACEWFRATVALGQRSEFFDARHTRAGLSRCADDAIMLFLAGAEREALASPFFQAFERSMRGSMLRPEIDDAGAELSAAERFYRAALARSPAFGEARVRLGRVLLERGHAAQAADELRTGLATALDPVVEYVGAMFLGTALETQGQLPEARDAYLRAARMTNGARVPHLALARVAFTLGDPAAMTSSLDDALRESPESTAADPWWSYRGLQARHADRWLAAVRRAARETAP